MVSPLNQTVGGRRQSHLKHNKRSASALGQLSPARLGVANRLIGARGQLLSLCNDRLDLASFVGVAHLTFAKGTDVKVSYCSRARILSARGRWSAPD